MTRRRERVFVVRRKATGRYWTGRGWTADVERAAILPAAWVLGAIARARVERAACEVVEVVPRPVRTTPGERWEG